MGASICYQLNNGRDIVMADLIYIFTSSSSIEHMLKKFEERDSNGRLRYSRIMLRLPGTFGSSVPLRISSIVSIVARN